MDVEKGIRSIVVRYISLLFVHFIKGEEMSGLTQNLIISLRSARCSYRITKSSGPMLCSYLHQLLVYVSGSSGQPARLRTALATNSRNPHSSS